MGIFSRLVDVVNANVNDLVDRAENPEKMLKQIIREIDESIDTSKRETAKVLAEAKRLEKELDRKAKDVDEWTKRAELAVDSNEDDLARKALERKRLHERELESLSTQVNETHAAVETMKSNTRTLQDKLTTARARLTTLAARGSAAKTVKAVQQQAAKLSDPNKALGKLEAFERRVEDMEAEAAAIGAVNFATDELEKEFADREESLAVDAELAALKARRNA